MNKRLRIGAFPRTRLRRNRQYPWYRNLISETKLNTEDLILPLFITEGKKIEEHIKTMPSIKRYSIDTVLKKIEEVKKFRIPAIALFPYVEKKLKTFDEILLVGSGKGVVALKNIPQIKWQNRFQVIYKELQDLYNSYINR